MSAVRDFVHRKVADALGASVADINPDDEFMSLGLDSMHAIFLIDEIEKHFNLEINPHSFWQFPTINSFSADLEKQLAG